jgi:[ribosomal protein S5]-alanine N-acetyltransferase
MQIAETSRLILRYFTRDDLDALTEIRADPEVMRFSLSGSQTRSQTRSFIEDTLLSYDMNGFGLCAVIDKANHHLIGYCGLLVWTEVDRQREIEIGYRLARSSWGKGLATEAAQATRNDGCDRLGFTRLISVIEAANVRSIRVAEKVGMRYEKDTQIKGIPVQIYAMQRLNQLVERTDPR